MRPDTSPSRATTTVGLGVALGVGVLALLVSAAGLFETTELKLFDVRLRLRGERPTHPAVVVVTMDEETRRVLGPDWRKRRIHDGELARALAYFGARLTAFDVIFDGHHEDDPEVAAAFAEAGNVYIPYYFLFGGTGEAWDPADVREVGAFLAQHPGAELEEVAAALERDPGLLQPAYEHTYALELLAARALPGEAPPTIWTAVDTHPPPLALLRAARGVGFAQLDPDEDHRGLNRDGVARRYPLFMRMGGRLYPSFALALFLDYTGTAPEELVLEPGKWLVLPRRPAAATEPSGPTLIPMDKDGEAILNWAGGWSSGRVFPRFSLGAVLDAYYLAVNGMEPSLPADELARLRDAIVLVGDTALDTPDRRAVPFESWYPMVGFQANALSGLLEGSFLRRWHGWERVSAVLALALLLGLVGPRLRPFWSSLWALGLLAVVLLAGHWLLVSRALWVDMLTPAAAIVLGQGGVLLAGFEAERRERRKVRRAFGHYVAPSVVDAVLRDSSRLRLGGEAREVSVLFSDIRDFTTLSESLEPEPLVALINEYLTVMTRVVYEHQGTLDKFVGDAIMAVYGAPLNQPDHAERACRTAIEMMARLHNLCRQWEASGRRAINIGIGINTGYAVAGNVGSPERMDYTVMGDQVNVASRLEGANKEFKTNIIISEATYRKVEGLAEVRSLGPIKVKGRMREIQVYELLGMKGGTSPVGSGPGAGAAPAG